MREGRMFDSGAPGERRGGHKRGWETGGPQRGGEGGKREHGAERRGPQRRGWEDAGQEFGAEQRGPRRGGPQGERDRARRGDARYIVLDALRDGPKHGYEIIKVLEERTAGRYVPSPGTVYPTLQYLEDQGFVRAKEEAERRVYELTETGKAELEAQATQVNAFWQRFGGERTPSVTRHEVRFLREELEQLERVVWNGLRPAIAQEQHDVIRHVRGAIEECQNKIRAIITSQQAE